LIGRLSFFAQLSGSKAAEVWSFSAANQYYIDPDCLHSGMIWISISLKLKQLLARLRKR